LTYNVINLLALDGTWGFDASFRGSSSGGEGQ
jgi:hypothetical protein